MLSRLSCSRREGKGNFDVSFINETVVIQLFISNTIKHSLCTVQVSFDTNVWNIFMDADSKGHMLKILSFIGFVNV